MSSTVPPRVVIADAVATVVSVSAIVSPVEAVTPVEFGVLAPTASFDPAMAALLFTSALTMPPVSESFE